MKILIIDKMHDSILPLLEAIGCRADYKPEIDRNLILSIISSYDGIIVRSKTPMDAEFLERAQHLKFVARAGAGIDNVDMEAMSKYGIQLLNAPEGNRDAVAEHTLAMLLSLMNKLHLANQQVRNRVWDREGNRGYELMGKTVGLLGFGYMGQAVAKRLSSFGCRILAFDIFPQKHAYEDVEIVDFDVFKRDTEILSIHIPLNTENKLLINTDYLSQFPKLQYVVNTSRGEVLKLSDMVAMLKDGRLKGAALDVLENEKLAQLNNDEDKVFGELISLDNVILSPHVAGWTFESYEKINQVLVEKIKNIV
ncbi:2-hydroxyacid dehydrogenase [Marivirga atlantica]|uniref:Phosphoglycerate dehydrogenase n=1 Tax=Marivirga atlantica TaxID=1548457 RepID=A0A937AFA7_9BACT|nr:NAD(P)-dependent oxidoreductase [Marivirga atlantica]MBL0765434.1 phosphoglycerate dehydrogenase [Marivirga atlantica]